jgi:hypothetical protein
MHVHHVMRSSDTAEPKPAAKVSHIQYSPVAVIVLSSNTIRPTCSKRQQMDAPPAAKSHIGLDDGPLVRERCEEEVRLHHEEAVSDKAQAVAACGTRQHRTSRDERTYPSRSGPRLHLASATRHHQTCTHAHRRGSPVHGGHGCVAGALGAGCEGRRGPSVPGGREGFETRGRQPCRAGVGGRDMPRLVPSPCGDTISGMMVGCVLSWSFARGSTSAQTRRLCWRHPVLSDACEHKSLEFNINRVAINHRAAGLKRARADGGRSPRASACARIRRYAAGCGL